MIKKLRLVEPPHIVIIVPKVDSKVDEVEEKPIKEQTKTEYNNYAKYHEELISINKLKAKLDAKNIGFSRLY